MPFYQGSIAETVLLDSIIDECAIGAIMHFAGSIVGDALAWERKLLERAA